MGYNVTRKTDPDDEYRNLLVIKDDAGERTYWDRGEPEDNSFIRDWNWVQGELIAAHAAGMREAATIVASFAREDIATAILAKIESK